MTIQKSQIRFRGKLYEVILEDGLVFFVDPLFPTAVTQVPQTHDNKVTSLDEAKRFALQMIERIPDPLMTFSD
jgi:hypothetical protein